MHKAAFEALTYFKVAHFERTTPNTNLKVAHIERTTQNTTIKIQQCSRFVQPLVKPELLLKENFNFN